MRFVYDVPRMIEAGRKAAAECSQPLTPRPFVAQETATFAAMPQRAEVLPFPSERSDAPAVRLALASILATGKPTQLEVARCSVNMRRAVAGLKALKPREGAPSPIKAIEELQRACSACAACRGI